MTDCPVPFVVSMPRSGSTLLRAMLDGHPQLCVPWESHFIPALWTRRGSYERETGFDARLFVADIMKTELRHWRLDTEGLIAAISSAGTTSYADAVRAVFRYQAARAGKPRYGDKTPGYLSEVPLLAGLFPEARFVHLIRDGRDVATSLREVRWGTSDIEAVAVEWRFRLQEARKAGELLGTQRYLQVNYECLVAEPEATLTRICAFIDLDFDPAMLGYPARAAELISPDPFREHHGNLFKPPTIGLRDWRTELSAEDVRRFEYIAGNELVSFGYPLSAPVAPH